MSAILLALVSVHVLNLLLPGDHLQSEVLVNSSTQNTLALLDVDSTVSSMAISASLSRIVLPEPHQR